MSNNKQTAVEWLLATLEQNSIIDLDWVDSDTYYTIINEAKQMEKEQNNHTEEHLEMVSSQTEISDDEIEKQALTFAKEESYGSLSTDLWKGYVFGAQWYRKQLKKK